MLQHGQVEPAGLPLSPAHHYAPPQQAQNPGQICCICLNEIQPHDTVQSCTTCHNEFHYGDLLTWLIIQTQQLLPVNCPACREDMRSILEFVPPADAQAPQDFDEDIPLGVQPAELIDPIGNWSPYGPLP